jgi:hypothetical protein
MLGRSVESMCMGPLMSGVKRGGDKKGMLMVPAMVWSLCIVAVPLCYQQPQPLLLCALPERISACLVSCRAF